jgi:hypothetical protein
MSALAKLAVVQFPPSRQKKSDEVLVHVRFYPNSEVATIDGRPDQLTPREWFERLHAAASQHYQSFAGGRGFFRIPASTYDAISRAPAN